MPSSRRCVFGCVTKGTTVHRFPNPAKFPEQFKAWVELGGEQLKNLSVEEVYPRLRVCDKHFIESHRNRNNRLSSLAIPTLHLPGASTVVMDTELESVQIEVPSSSQQLLSGASTVVMDTELKCVQIEVPSSSQQLLSGLHAEQSIGLEVEEGSAKHNMPRQNNFPSALSLPGLLLYKNDASPPSWAVMMLGDLLGLKFDYKKPEMNKLEHKSPEFKKINPMGTIPVLQDGDFIVSESHAIMKYLLNKYGGALQEKLYPSEPQQQAIVDQCLFFDAGVLFPRLKVIALPSFLHGLAGPTPQHLADVEEAYSVVEAYLQKNRYIAGNRMTIADLSLGTTMSVTQAVLELDQNKFPRSVEWLARLQKEKCFKEINNPGAALFTKLLHMYWQKNKK